MNCSYIVLKEPVWPVDLLGGGSGLFPFGAPPSDPKCTRPRERESTYVATRLSVSFRDCPPGSEPGTLLLSTAPHRERCVW